MSTSTRAFFTREGAHFVPTGLGVSPWNRRAQLGVALAGLAGQLIDATPTPAPMITSRLTVDILGAVPIEPLLPAVRLLRDGKRMQTLEITLSAGDRIGVRATALRVRRAETPDCAPPLPHPVPCADAPREKKRMAWYESVRVDGDFKTPGPGSLWVRLDVDVIDGEPTSPLAAMAMIADFGAGTGPLLPLAEWTLANLDITVYLTRAPIGEWLLIEAESEGAGTGIGVSRSRIGDMEGMFGTALQTVFLERR
jgi:hypothetical protein